MQTANAYSWRCEDFAGVDGHEACGGTRGIAGQQMV
jgi:hypothetical protein